MSNRPSLSERSQAVADAHRFLFEAIAI